MSLTVVTVPYLPRPPLADAPPLYTCFRAGHGTPTPRCSLCSRHSLPRFRIGPLHAECPRPLCLCPLPTPSRLPGPAFARLLHHFPGRQRHVDAPSLFMLVAFFAPLSGRPAARQMPSPVMFAPLPTPYRLPGPAFAGPGPPAAVAPYARVMPPRPTGRPLHAGCRRPLSGQGYRYSCPACCPGRPCTPHALTINRLVPLQRAPCRPVRRRSCRLLSRYSCQPCGPAIARGLPSPVPFVSPLFRFADRPCIHDERRRPIPYLAGHCTPNAVAFFSARAS